MNDNHSRTEETYLPRWLNPEIRDALKTHSVVVLTGARQVGKSTLLQHATPTRHWRYLTLDDFDVLSQAQRDPDSLLVGTKKIVLDEVQKAPSLLSAVKRAVDKDRKGFRAILSGSANLLLMEKVSETLAGRAVYLTLWPMSLGEVYGHPAPKILTQLFAGKFPKEGKAPPAKVQPMEILSRGLMPPLIRISDPKEVLRWWEGYVATYLERDLRQISQITSLAEFRRVMGTMALRSGQIINTSHVANDTDVPQANVYRYLNLLEATCVLQKIPAFARNRNKRLIKSPKAYWVDAGMACFLAGYFGTQSVEKARERGGFWETLFLQHLRSLAQLLVPRPEVFYWRTTNAEEVDFVLERGRDLLAFEVKLSSTPRYSDCEHLASFLKEYPETRAAVLVHTGEEILRLGEKIIALPWTLFCMGKGKGKS